MIKIRVNQKKLSKTQALVPTDAIVTDQLVDDIRILIEKKLRSYCPND